MKSSAISALNRKIVNSGDAIGMNEASSDMHSPSDGKPLPSLHCESSRFANKTRLPCADDAEIAEVTEQENRLRNSIELERTGQSLDRSRQRSREKASSINENGKESGEEPIEASGRTCQRISPTVWGVGCMVASPILFAINSLLIKYLSSIQSVSPWTSLLFRAGIGLAFVSVFFRGTERVSFYRIATNRLLVLRGFFGVLGSIAYYFTIPTLGPGKATLISNTYVVIASVIAIKLLREKMPLQKLVGNLIAVVGLVLLLGVSPAELSKVGWNELLAIFGATMAACTVIVIRQLTQSESSATIFSSQCIYILLFSLPFSIASFNSRLSVIEVGLLSIAALCATVGQLAMTEGFRYLTIAVGGAFQNLGPVLIALGGILWFDEIFSPSQGAGAILILTGCYWTVVAKRSLPRLQ